MSSRRTTLGVLGPGALNARASIGPARVGRPATKQQRQSMHPGGAARRRSVGGPKRPSSAGTGRRSSQFGGVGGRAVLGKQDPRQINDRQFQMACSRALVEYLSKHGFERPVSANLVKSVPSARQIEEIFHFLYRQLDPQYDFGKFQDEVISIFKKLLKYPTAISKSALTAAGAPHTWPVILAALGWLIELLNYLEVAEHIRHEQEAVDQDVGERIFFEFLARSYDEYMGGVDDHSQLEMELRAQFDAKNKLLRDHTDRVRVELERIAREIEGLKKKPSLIELEDRKRLYFKDIDKFNSVIADLKSHRQAVEIKLNEYRVEHQSKEADLQEFMRQRDELRVQVESQEISAEDVMKMTMEKRQLEDKLRGVQERTDAAKSDLHDREIQLGKRMAVVEDLAAQYSRLAGALGLLDGPVDGVSFDVRLDGRTDEICVADMEAIKPALQRHRDRLTQRTYTTQDDLVASQEIVDRGEESLAEQTDVLAAVEEELRQIQAECQKEKDATTETLSAIAEERGQMESEVGRLQATSAESIEETDRRLTALHAQYEEEGQRCEAEKEAFNRALFTTLDLLTTHKAHVQEGLAAVEATATRVHADICSGGH